MRGTGQAVVFRGFGPYSIHSGHKGHWALRYSTWLIFSIIDFNKHNNYQGRWVSSLCSRPFRQSATLGSAHQKHSHILNSYLIPWQHKSLLALLYLLFVRRHESLLNSLYHLRKPVKVEHTQSCVTNQVNANQPHG